MKYKATIKRPMQQISSNEFDHVESKSESSISGYIIVEEDPL